MVTIRTWLWSVSRNRIPARTGEPGQMSFHVLKLIPIRSRRLAMKVRDVMTKGAECVTPSTTLQDGARKMKHLDVGSLPVCENDRLVGMLTDRDIVVRAVADGCDTKTTTAREVMTPDIVYCFD